MSASNIGVAALVVPTLESARLILQPLSSAHSDGMFALWSRPEVCRYAGEARDKNGDPIMLPACTPADSDKIIAFFVAAQAAGTGFRWALLRRGDQQFIGAAGFNAIGPCSEYAYHLHPDFWGQGLMTEASRVALAWLFADPTRTSAEGFIDPENLPSVKLVRRLGFMATEGLKDGAQRYVMFSTALARR
jgi:ribosomal-protein-alanine N-acetyltransferase